VYEIPVSGEGSNFAPPSAPILEPQRSDYPPPGSFEPSTAGFGAPAPGSAAPGFAPPPTGSASAPFPAPPSYAAPAPGFPAPGFAAPGFSEPAAFPPPAAFSAPAPERAPQQEFVFSSAQPTKPERSVPEGPFSGSVTSGSVTDRFVEPENQTPIAMVDPQLIAVLHEVLMAIASDLHISADAVPMIRVDGGLRPVPSGTVWGKEKVRTALLSLLTPVQRAEFEQKLELDFAYTLSANARFRVNFYQDRGALGAAFRLIPTQILALDKLGVPEVVARFATLARGLVLVTGPTGSGKSTTIAALIDMINRTRADHIVTVEDPIEFLHTNQRSLINQREVGADTHSFGAALKHVLRQDPDVILIGELRDLETISAALTAAETGHLVFATLHTQDAPQTIDRIIDVFPAHQQAQIRSQVAATLQGVVCQTLVKRANGKGRAVAAEVLITTPAVANLIREGKTFQIASSMQAGRDLGMHTLDQHLAELVNEGTITHETALERVHDPEGFKRLVRREPTSAADGFSLADQQGFN
jgi:twitching motility protein PilT